MEMHLIHFFYQYYRFDPYDIAALRMSLEMIVEIDTKKPQNHFFTFYLFFLTNSCLISRMTGPRQKTENIFW